MKINKLLLVCALTVCCRVCANAEDGKVLLRIEYPKPLFSANGPVPISGYNLEPIRFGKPPELFVAEGTTNLALRKPVAASCQATVGNLAMITDGDKDGDEGGWVELAAGKQWVQIDLQSQAEIYAVVVWHFHFKTRIYSNVVVGVSDDPEFKKEVKIIFNNDTEDVIGWGKGTNFSYLDKNWGKLIDAKGSKGRYVRFYSNGNSANKLNHYVEVEVYGKQWHR